MPEKDIYEGILPKSANQSAADYDAYLTQVAQERLPVVNNTSIDFFKRSALNKLSVPKQANIVNSAPSVTSAAPSVSPNGLAVMPVVPVKQPASIDMQRQNVYNSDLKSFQQANPINLNEKNEKFISEVQDISPALRKEAQLSYNKEAVKRRNALSFDQRVMKAKEQMPNISDDQAFRIATIQQANEDLQLSHKIDKIPTMAFDNMVGKQQILKELPEDSGFDKPPPGTAEAAANSPTIREAPPIVSSKNPDSFFALASGLYLLIISLFFLYNLDT